MNKASGVGGQRPNLGQWGLNPPVFKTESNAPSGHGMVRRPLKSLRKGQARGMPFFPLSR